MTEKFQMIFPVPDVSRVHRIPRIPFEALAVQCEEGKIRAIDYLPYGHGETDTRPSNNALVNEIEVQLHKYFEEPESVCFRELQGKLATVDGIPPEVQKAICEVPCGSVDTYGEIAKTAKKSGWDGKDGKEGEDKRNLKMKLPQKVGRICNRSPYAIVVPCYRVVLKGDSTGFCLGEFKGNKYMERSNEREITEKQGEKIGRQIKRWLLRHEGVQVIEPENSPTPDWECIPLLRKD